MLLSLKCQWNAVIGWCFKYSKLDINIDRRFVDISMRRLSKQFSFVIWTIIGSSNIFHMYLGSWLHYCYDSSNIINYKVSNSILWKQANKLINLSGRIPNNLNFLRKISYDLNLSWRMPHNLWLGPVKRTCDNSQPAIRTRPERICGRSPLCEGSSRLVMY